MVVSADSVIEVLLSPIVVFPLLVIVPARLILLGAVAVNPAENVVLALAAFPSVKDPVLVKVVALLMVVEDPTNDKLYAPDPELKLVAVKLPENETEPVCELLMVIVEIAPLVPAV
jgi:hypothetical protein